MVKLIRLSTSDNKLFFDNNFQAQINIEPKSQIGLLNCNFEKDKVAVTITPNDKMTFTFDRNGKIAT